MACAQWTAKSCQNQNIHWWQRASQKILQQSSYSPGPYLPTKSLSDHWTARDLVDTGSTTQIDYSRALGKADSGVSLLKKQSRASKLSVEDCMGTGKALMPQTWLKISANWPRLFWMIRLEMFPTDNFRYCLVGTLNVTSKITLSSCMCNMFHFKSANNTQIGQVKM